MNQSLSFVTSQSSEVAKFEIEARLIPSLATIKTRIVGSHRDKYTLKSYNVHRMSKQKGKVACTVDTLCRNATPAFLGPPRQVEKDSKH